MTWTTSDMFKEPYRVKVIPDAEPGADGEWQILMLGSAYLGDWDYLSSLVAEGYHVVAIERAHPKVEQELSGPGPRM